MVKLRLAKPRLRRDLTALLAFKLIALTLLYLAFFAPSHRPTIDPAAHIGESAAAR